ncbi:hypothetical protein P7K49_017635 [Saguinus oedipus]|uniref:Uncharacterized protein n=1 Tax=Saguinus oedipus TaxID=9490 RepID=A0ABQ9V470_SAGOE|nr:hypothetical protein P7K49_017635 [Saguinus oedipus]
MPQQNYLRPRPSPRGAPARVVPRVASFTSPWSPQKELPAPGFSRGREWERGR